MSRWRRISSITAVCIPARLSCSNGFPASTAPSCFSSPTSTTRGTRSVVATRSSPRICSLDASEDSSTTSTVFENEARRLRSPLAVPRPSTIPAWRARNLWTVSDPIPDSRSKVRAAEADGARPAAL